MVDGRDNAWRNRAPGPHAHGNTARQAIDGLWTEAHGQQKRPRKQPAHPQYANYWAPLTRKRHTMPHSAQPQHTNYWAPRTRKRHQQEHRPQRPTESSNLTQHAEGRTGDCPGPREGTTTRRNVTQGGKGAAPSAGRLPYSPPQRCAWLGTVVFTDTPEADQCVLSPNRPGSMDCGLRIRVSAAREGGVWHEALVGGGVSGLGAMPPPPAAQRNQHDVLGDIILYNCPVFLPPRSKSK